MATLVLQSQLPVKFAEDLLDCQIEFELNPDIPHDTVLKLLQLYRLGIQYYESVRSYKYLYFQRKMNHIVKSQTILQNLNQPKPQPKPEILLIQSLSDFKKQKISLQHLQQSAKLQSTNKKSTPFKKHLEQKFLSKTHDHQSQKIKLQRQNQLRRLKLERQSELRKLTQLQHKEKHQQLAQTVNSIQSDTVMKNFILSEDKKMQQIQQKVGKSVQEQEQEFRKKLQERRQRVKSNTQKRRLTKSFSDNYDLPIVSTGDLQHQMANVQNCELKVSLDAKGNRPGLSTRMVASFAEDTSNSLNWDEFVYEEVANPNHKK